MEVVLLGTGSAEGWPNPFCACASCASARAAGLLRSPTSALVDGRLLLDCGPEAPRAADRAGRSLADVRTILLTHAHPDHVAPAALLWRGWAGQAEPLEVFGPSAALDVCRNWVSDDDPVSLRPITAGERFENDGYEVRVLAANHGGGEVGEALLYDVTTPDGSRLLYATDTGPLPDATIEAVRDRNYDVVLLEETFGEHTSHGTDHLDLSSFPRELARLREAGGVNEQTIVVAVHLSHHNPPEPELSRRLAQWGAHAVPDLTTIGPSETPHIEQTPKRVLLLGGARSGKSVEAERRFADRKDVIYVATGGERGDDPEWAVRVAAHRARRPETWTTVVSTEVSRVLASAGPNDAVLIDCLALWMTAVLDDAGAWDDDGGDTAEVDRRVDELVSAWRSCRGDVVAVTNEVGQGIVPASASGRLFRDELGRLNARIAAEADEVTLVVAGQLLPLKTVPNSRPNSQPNSRPNSRTTIGESTQ